MKIAPSSFLFLKLFHKLSWRYAIMLHETASKVAWRREVQFVSYIRNMYLIHIQQNLSSILQTFDTNVVVRGYLVYLLKLL